MSSHTPLFLMVEMRAAFRQCSRLHCKSVNRQYAKGFTRQFQIAQLRFVQRAPSGSSTKQKQQEQEQRLPQQARARQPESHSTSEASSKFDQDISPQSSDVRALVPQDQHGRSLGDRRTTDAPMKIIPPANITPTVQLSPRERLHIEILTRRPPPLVKQVKPYKERLLVYHHGNLTNNALVFLRVLGLVCASTVSAVVVPAHYLAGTAPWLCGILLVGGWVPTLLFHRLLQPLVTRIHLRLPPNARTSPDAAMKYAKNLPTSAQIDIDFTRMTALPGTISVNVADLRPISSGSQWPWQVANIKWIGDHVDRGSLFRRNPTEFYVKPETGAGKAKRDVVPGIWPEVYNRLTGIVKEPISRWKRT